MIIFTKNQTTVFSGQSIATVICDSINDGNRITSVEIVYPRYIHADLMSHRCFSRSASSSRATPFCVTINEVKTDPVFFDELGKNQSGMQAKETLSKDEAQSFKEDWSSLGRLVADRVEQMENKYHLHKQILNRALEPWSRIHALITSTEWSNFFALRLSGFAQPEMKNLALAMIQSMRISTPSESRVHLPFVEHSFSDEHEITKIALANSVARCARISYARLDGRPQSDSDDLRLYDSLSRNRHMSPFEHIAFADRGWFANFYGWRSARYNIEMKEKSNGYIC